MYLAEKLHTISVDDDQSIPWIVWLLENPDSLVSLPGRITLSNHDYLHVILDQNLSLSGKASVIGFCMGNDPDTNKIHILIFKFFWLYRNYRGSH